MARIIKYRIEQNNKPYSLVFVGKPYGQL